MKPRKLKPIKAGFDDDFIAFYPRMISQAEREEVDRQLSEVGAESINKHQQVFEIKRDAIAEWSTETPKKIVKTNGENQLEPLVADVENAADAMRSFFEKRTVENEEIIIKVYNGFLNLMSADVSFL